MSAFTHSSTCTLHSAVAIGISCTQSLGVDFSPATPRGAGAGIVCIVCRVHARTVREKTRTGLGGRAHMSIQGGSMIISIMSISLRITFKPVRYHSKMSKQSALGQSSFRSVQVGDLRAVHSPLLHQPETILGEVSLSLGLQDQVA